MKLLGRYPLQYIWNAFQGFFSHSQKDGKSTLEYMQLKAEFDDDSATVSDSEHELTLYRKPKEAVTADALSDTSTIGSHSRPVYFKNGVPVRCTAYMTAMTENRTFNSGDMDVGDSILVVNHNKTANKAVYIKNTGSATLSLNICNRVTRTYLERSVAAGATSADYTVDKCGGIAYITKTATNTIYISREYTT